MFFFSSSFRILILSFIEWIFDFLLALFIHWIILNGSHIIFSSHQHLNSLSSSVHEDGKTKCRTNYNGCNDTSRNASSFSNKTGTSFRTRGTSCRIITSSSAGRGAMRWSFDNTDLWIAVNSQTSVSFWHINWSEHTSLSGAASIISAHVIIITIDNSVLATLYRVTRVGRASIIIITIDYWEFATVCRIASIISASISIEAWRNVSSDARSTRRITSGSMASIDWSAWNGSEDALVSRSRDRARVGGAQVIVGTNDWNSEAGTVRLARLRTAWIWL